MELVIVSTHNDWKYVFAKLQDAYPAVFHYKGQFFFQVKNGQDIEQKLKHILAGLYYGVEVKKSGVW